MKLKTRSAFGIAAIAIICLLTAGISSALAKSKGTPCRSKLLKCLDKCASQSKQNKFEKCVGKCDGKYKKCQAKTAKKDKKYKAKLDKLYKKRAPAFKKCFQDEMAQCRGTCRKSAKEKYPDDAVKEAKHGDKCADSVCKPGYNKCITNVLKKYPAPKGTTQARKDKADIKQTK